MPFFLFLPSVLHPKKQIKTVKNHIMRIMWKIRRNGAGFVLSVEKNTAL